MRAWIICAILLAAGCSDQGKDATPALPDLTIGAGETRTIAPGETNLAVRNLVMGDKARIVFDPAVTDWTLKAERASFGTGAIIDGSGRAGASGPDTAPAQPAARRCEAGIAGLKGGQGQPGGRGVNLNLSFGAVGSGTLQVIASGGAGGRGGAGQAGQAGGPLYCGRPPFGTDRCDPGAGGLGGDAGPGGTGGDAGTINIRAPAADAFSTVAQGGPGGISGVAGPGGRSGRSESCGPRSSRPSPNGRAGTIQNTAPPGKDGVVTFQ